MTALAQILAGSRLTAAALQGIAPLAALKAVDQSVTSSTTFVNDSALFLAMPANSSWVFIALLEGTGAANGSGDLKLQFTGPTGASAVIESLGFSTTSVGPLSGNAIRGLSGSMTIGLNGGSGAPAIIIGSVTIGSTSGTFQLQWAQNTSSATATTVKAGSVLAAWQIA